MKILHAADLHIDSPLGGLTAYEGAPADEIRGATRRAAENLVQAAIDNRVELLLLAGDIFDGDWPDFGTGLFWSGLLERLHAAAIPVVSVAGNHDAQSQISRHLKLPPNVTQLSTSRPQRKVFDNIEVEVIGQGYARRATRDDLSAAYPEGDSQLFSVGLLHTSLDGRPGHAPYAPCTVEALRSKGYQYWALGHIHTREILHRDPWIVFPGNLQGRHARETGPKGATLLTVEERQIVSVASLALDDVRWELCRVPADELGNVDDVLGEVTEQLETLAENAAQRLSAVRVQIVGASAAHAQLWSNPGALEAEIRRTATRIGRVWVEKVHLQTTRPIDLARAREEDAVGQLARRIEELRTNPETLAAYEPLFADLRKKIGADARTPDGAPIDTSRIATAEHLAQQLDASLELVVSLLAAERA